ncbi:ThuA domain-containing protein [Sediminicola luteus]|uniref:ThuA-like domain-containing protein n=1 Tax=Sediminicola luteus TaxID=319238 RepID=A0A2A4GAY9_9FLAO|nr:hypothetical protein [Sediminicola luteus]PCE65767.1 hypothetical protein B7P33_00220 [Sediminicola luteus]
MKLFKLLLGSLFVILIGCTAQKPVVGQLGQNESGQWLSFNGGKADAKKIVFVSGDEEYRSEEALPMLAKIMSTRYGYDCTVLFAQQPSVPGVINPNYGMNIPGLEALADADLMVIFTRFRKLPDAQMKHIDEYLKSGRPVVGIRTSTHAFNFADDANSSYIHYKNGYKGDKKEWADGFGRLVLGEKWISHHGHHKHQSTRGIVAAESASHPITNGIKDADVWGSTDVYGVRLPMLDGVQPMILGQVINRAGEYDANDVWYGMKPSDSEVADTNKKGQKLNDPMMPVAWTKPYQLPGGKKGMAFASTVGSSSDLLVEGTRRLLVNGIIWSLGDKVPAKANVDVIGEYNPSQYAFQKNEYWESKNMKVTDQK